VQWQVCRKKQNKLEFLMPWWDLQLGISVNQFLSIFASKNSDFRYAGLRSGQVTDLSTYSMYLRVFLDV
jgi:hypothetical protein